MSMFSLLKRPSGYVPIAISWLVFASILLRLVWHGATPAPDEDAGAHLFQLLMPAALAVMLFFAIRWFPRDPKAAAPVATMQLVSASAVFAIVFTLRW